MATVTERLAFLISANADQAIRAFDKTANSAQKEMTKATKSIDQVAGSMTRLGARGLAVTGTLGAGLFKLAQSAIEDQKAQRLLAQQMRITTKATDEQIASVEEYIDTTARAIGVADDELRPAFQTLIRATGSVVKSQELLNLALDISAGTGKDLSVVTLALSKASTGQVSALTRLGVPLSDNVKKSKDFAGAVKELNAQFRGQAAVAADSYAGRLARAKIALQETGEEIGTAFIPVIEKSASTVATAANAFSGLNKTTGGAIGTLASYGTIALGVVSTVSLLAGQMIKARAAFTTAEGSLSTLGRTAKGAGFALATIALTEATFSAVNKATGAFDAMDESLNDLLATFDGINTSQSSPVGAATAAFADMVKAEADALKVSHLWTDFGKRVKIGMSSSKRDIEDADSAFKKLLDKGGAPAAQLLIDDMRALASTMSTTSDNYKDTIMLIERYEAKIRNLTAAQQGLNAVQQSAQEAAAAAEEAERKAEEAKLRAAEAAEKYKEKIKSLRTELRDKFTPSLDAAREQLKKANDAFKDYSNTVSNAVRSTYSLGGALDEGETYMARLRKTAQDALTFSANLQRLVAMNISEDTMNMILSSGAETGAAFAEELVRGGQAAVDEADALTESVKQAGQRAGTDAATSYYQNGVNLATNLVNGIDSIIKKYTLTLKSKNLTDKQLKKLQKDFKLEVGFSFSSMGYDVPELADGGIVPATRGGRLIRVAEAGQDEAIIPLPTGMRTSTVGGGDTNVTIHVNGGDPNAVVDALRRYVRQNGAVPIRVTG